MNALKKFSLLTVFLTALPSLGGATVTLLKKTTLSEVKAQTQTQENGALSLAESWWGSNEALIQFACSDLLHFPCGALVAKLTQKGVKNLLLDTELETQSIPSFRLVSWKSIDTFLEVLLQMQEQGIVTIPASIWSPFTRNHEESA